MKGIFIFILFTSLLANGQIGDSVRKRAIFLQGQAFKAEQKHDFQASVLFADSSIILDSTRYEAFVIKAESLWFLHRYAEAAEAYKGYMRVKRPDFLIGAFVLLGMLYDKADLPSEARKQYLIAIKTFENGYIPPKFDKTEEFEYVFAFGLLGDKKNWKKKLNEISKKYPSQNYQELKKKTRKELVEFHFSSFGD